VKRLAEAILAASLMAGIPAIAQQDAPEIKFDSVPNALQLPANIYLAKWAAWQRIRAATSSSTRAPGKKGTPPASSPMFAASRLTRKVMSIPLMAATSASGF
jgi:hypothetical protein